MKAEKQSENEKKNSLAARIKETSLIVLCFAAAMGSRFFLLLSGKEAVNGSGYFEAAMIRTQQLRPQLTSGIAFAYTESLSRIFKFSGNRLDAAVIYQFILQAVIFFLLLFGCYLLIGKAAAAVCAAAFSFLPWPINSMFEISPESYFLYWWSFVFLMIGLLYKKTKEKKEHGSIGQVFYLMLTGFLVGVICIRHYLGFLLIVFLVYGILRNAASIKGKKKIITAALQVLLLIFCMLLGGYCTLIRYTEIMGNTLAKQFAWWQKQIRMVSGGKWQDLALWFPIWMISTLAAGSIFQLMVHVAGKRKGKILPKESETEQNKVPEVIAGETEMIQNEEEKKVKLIENPLPLPKKHVRKKMDFELDEKLDDFDFEINENDDFDV